MASRRPIHSEARLLAGIACLTGALASGELALAHARWALSVGDVCGSAPALHCGWCPLTLALLAMAAVCFRAPRQKLAAARAD